MRNRAYIVVAGMLAGVMLAGGCDGRHRGPGEVTTTRLSEAAVAARARGYAPGNARDGAGDTQILFGDLHVHTTFSADAFMLSLPLMGGSGAHPPADACDYARFCAGLDFWSINDHAESISPRHWSETVDSIRQCNDVAGDPANPDTVAFLGWEWSQVGPTPEDHFGHKNVILRGTEDAAIPARPIAAPRPDFRVAAMPTAARIALPLLHAGRAQEYFDYFRYREEVENVALCPPGTPTTELPTDCHEIAADPAELFEKLDDWGFDALVIPHGTAWGLMTPEGSSWEQQRDQRSDRQGLLEIYSGHGNSEEFRDFPETRIEGGNAICPAPTKDFLPCCWQAGEIIRSRCSADTPAQTCDERVQRARANYARAGSSAHNTVPGATIEDWLDCDQCTDCFLPTFSHRPGMSAQYATARDLRFGFVGASDSHAAHAGNGFKEHSRRELSEARAPSGALAGLAGGRQDKEPESIAVRPDELPIAQRRYTERGASFLVTGGLAAVHARGRDRDAIYDALERRQTYATSGDRILLWFDLENGAAGPVPMGAEVSGQRAAPTFRVRAAGALEQRAGCPEFVTAQLGEDREEKLCLGECFHPGNERRRITRIEVVRIRTDAGIDSVTDAIEDPWRVLPCPETGEVCEVRFQDADFPVDGRATAYYVRAIQEPTLAVNGGGLRCERDANGGCVRVDPCFSDTRTPIDDDCLAEIEERAWSSPIFVDPQRIP